jgi:hypothetical protein
VSNILNPATRVISSGYGICEAPTYTRHPTRRPLSTSATRRVGMSACLDGESATELSGESDSLPELGSPPYLVSYIGPRPYALYSHHMYSMVLPK